MTSISASVISSRSVAGDDVSAAVDNRSLTLAARNGATTVREWLPAEVRDHAVIDLG